MSSSSIWPAVCFAVGKQSQTPYSSYPTPSEVTLTRRHHPLVGQRFEVVFGGPTRIVVRVADGTMRVPRSWTDADGVPAQPEWDRVFSVEALKDLLELVEALRRGA